MNLKEWLISINLSKRNIIDGDPSMESDYNPYIINKVLSGNLDCILFANEMNKYNLLDKKLQYDFYLNSIKKRKRYSPLVKKEELENIEYIKKYYNYSDEKAKYALKLLSKKNIEYIKSKFYTGGTSK